jgi:hypothetical protein
MGPFFIFGADLVPTIVGKQQSSPPLFLAIVGEK